MKKISSIYPSWGKKHFLVGNSKRISFILERGLSPIATIWGRIRVKSFWPKYLNVLLAAFRVKQVSLISVNQNTDKFSHDFSVFIQHNYVSIKRHTTLKLPMLIMVTLFLLHCIYNFYIKLMMYYLQSSFLLREIYRFKVYCYSGDKQRMKAIF